MNLKKTLIAAAVAAVVATPAASYADATLYGAVKTSLQSVGAYAQSGAGSKSELNFQSGPWSASRIGVKGSDNMVGGMSSFYKLELKVAGVGSNAQSTNSVGPDPSTGYSTRLAYMGMKGRFGTVAAGRMGDLFYSYVSSAVDPTYQVVSGLGPFGNGYFYRVTGLAYVSPNLGGFSGGIAIGNIGTDNNSTSTNYGKQQQIVELGGKYTFGPGFVSAGYISIPKDSVQLGSRYKGVAGIAGGYTFGMFGVAANVMKTSHSSAATKLYDITSYAIEGKVAVGAIDGYVMYSGAKSAESGSHTASRIAVGVSYAVSKPLSVALEVASNDATANAIGGNVAVSGSVDGFTTTNSSFKSSSNLSLSAVYKF